MQINVYIIFLFVFTSLVLLINAKDVELKTKGEICESSVECDKIYPCVSGVCGCEKGSKAYRENHFEDFVYTCRKVLGLGCDRDADCNSDLDHSRCDHVSRTCICRHEDSCKGASVLSIASHSTIILILLAVLKM